VGGGIVAVVPGKFAVGTFSPPLDAAGNSVRSQRAIEAIIQKLNGNVFASRPASPPAARDRSNRARAARAGGADPGGREGELTCAAASAWSRSAAPASWSRRDGAPRQRRIRC